MKKSNKIKVTLTSLVLVVGGVLAFVLLTDKDQQKTMETKIPDTQNASVETPASITTPKTTNELLLYLIEEEKLAHDVYAAMHQKYGAAIFGTILESESTHQDRVLTLLQPRNIPDPRSTDLGIFSNRELQALYDQLIEQGNISLNDAYKAGVAIEEKDIADISTQLATATDQDVIDVLEALRKGSENHLRAFNRQL